jgi:hypothetical protein
MNSTLQQAKRAKNDEFYTQLSDIEKELKHYKDHFKDKVVYCNCDGAESMFVKYFTDNATSLGIRDFYNTSNDFRTNTELLQKADIIVTNPPFSLFREYVAQLMEYDKKFLIIGNQNAVTYKEVFKLIKENKIWLGCSMNGSNRWFEIPYDYDKYHKIENGKKYAFVASVTWFTNLDISKRNEELILYKTYEGNESDYPKYDNYDAIEVSKVREIPMDYDGYMGVPITFLYKHNPEQFELVKFRKGDDDKDLCINGKCPYFRIIIKRKDIT